jgi:hypothetical protein
MRRVIALSHHDPRYLKTTYAHPLIDHVDHERHIKAGTRYLTWDNGYAVYRMTWNRQPVLMGRSKSIHEAISMTST